MSINKAKAPTSFSRLLLTGQGHFETRDLVIIGLFAGAAKATAIIIALMGGGMNPPTLMLKNIVFASLWVILLCKVPKTGTLALANTVSALLGFFLLGQAMISLPSLIAATLLVELIIKAIGGLKKGIMMAVLAVAISELIMRIINLFIGYLGVREQPGLLVMVLIISAVGYLGILVGLFAGVKMVKELKHAGLIQS